MTFRKYCTICNDWYNSETCPTCEEQLKTPVAKKAEQKIEKKPKPKKQKPRNFKKSNNIQKPEDKKTLDEKIQQLIAKYNNND